MHFLIDHWRLVSFFSVKSKKFHYTEGILYNFVICTKKKWNGRITNTSDFTKQYPKTQEKLNQIKETNENGEEVIKQKGIQWGEFFEFFWSLYDSKQLENFEGEFITPRKTEIEEILTGVEKNILTSANQISKTIETRLNELKTATENAQLAVSLSQSNSVNNINDNISTIATLLGEISSRIRSSNY